MVGIEPATLAEAIEEFVGNESANGWHGTIVDAFGVYSEPSIGAVLEHVPIR